MPSLVFAILSGGTVEIDLSLCATCLEKPCLSVCRSPFVDGPLVAGMDGMPSLRMEQREIERGGCSECLGCELECRLLGRNAVKITLPIPYLETENAADDTGKRNWRVIDDDPYR